MAIHPIASSHHPHKRLRDNDSEIQLAIFCGNVDKIWKLVNAGEKIPRLIEGDSNLRIIVQNCRDPNLIEYVLNSMTIEEVNYRSLRTRTTALNDAARYCNPSVVELLLKAKADVNQVTPNDTPLHTVSFGDRIEPNFSPLTDPRKQHMEELSMQDTFQRAVQKAQLLIRYGAKIDSHDRDGASPLYKCIEKGKLTNYVKPHLTNFVNTDLIALLVSEGADPITCQIDPIRVQPRSKEEGLILTNGVSRMNQAMQKGLTMRRQEVKEALPLQLSNPVVDLVTSYDFLITHANAWLSNNPMEMMQQITFS